MKLQMFAIKDAALDTFLRPFAANTSQQAARLFQDEINNPQGDMFKHPDDYTLYNLGDWTDETGAFNTHSQPILILRGKDCKDLK